MPREAIRLPGGSGNTTRGDGVRRGVGFAVGLKNSATPRVSTTRAPPAFSCAADGSAGGALRGRGGRPGNHRRHAPGRAAGARQRGRDTRRRLDRPRRVLGVDLGLADDVDGRRRRPARVTGRAGGTRTGGRRRGRRRARLPPSADVSRSIRDGAGRRRPLPRRVRGRGDAGRRRGGRRGSVSRGSSGSGPRRTSGMRSTAPRSRGRSRAARRRASASR